MATTNAVNYQITSSNLPYTIVKRDGSGNFSAGTITATFIGNITGAATQATHVATNTSASFYPLLVSTPIDGSNIFNLATVFSVNASTGLVQTGNINSSSLTASRIIFTDGTKTYTSSPPAVPQSVMLTNQTSYTANGVLFQNSAGNAFSTTSALTYNGSDSFVLSTGNASSEIICKNTNSGGSEARFILDRGNAGSGNNGYAQVRYSTNSATVWEVGLRHGVTTYTIRSGSSDRVTITTGGTFTISGGPFVQGDFSDADKFQLMGNTSAAKIAHGAGWSFNSYAGAFTSIGGAGSTGQFTWNTVASSGSAFQQVMFLSNSGLLTLSLGSVSAPTGTSLLNLNSATQVSSRITLSGQEFYQAANTSTDGIALLAGVNRSGNRQFWIGDSAALTQNSTNKTIRIQPNSGQIDAMATDGSTQLPIQFGQSGAATTISGSSITLSGGNTSITGGDLDITRSTTSAVMTTTRNTNNSNAAANARVQVVSGGGSGGDAIVTFTISGVQDWVMGIDNSVSDQFIIGASDTAGTSDKLRISTSAGDITAVTGSLIVDTAGKTLSVKTGSNACAGKGAVLVGGTVTVNTTAVSTGDIILLTRTTTAGTPGFISYTIVNATSFTINSSSGSDTSTFSWIIFKAP